MELMLGAMRVPPVRALELEIVERKGRGHPDSLCDAMAEEFSHALCRFYVEHFGIILHHNVDKALLVAGVSRPALGGGHILAPMRLYLAGRATLDREGVSVPVDELAVDATTAWIRRNLRALDPDRHLEVRPLVRAGSRDLAELFERQLRLGLPLANDTSIGIGYAPLTELEAVVMAVEATLSTSGAKGAIPEAGEDIKVMGVRRRHRMSLTVACAFLGQLLPNMRAYLDAKERVRAAALDAARPLTRCDVTVDVNVADDPASGSIYITVTGISAEAGDDGQAGRGNRANGLITPQRPMTLESAAGKNPVSHVGKLYQVAAQRIADALTSELPGVRAAECCLVSQIGRPVDDPQLADVRIELEDRLPPALLAPDVERIVHSELERLRWWWRDYVRAPSRVG